MLINDKIFELWLTSKTATFYQNVTLAILQTYSSKLQCIEKGTIHIHRL